MSEFQHGQKVVTTQHDPNFGFGKDEEGVVVGHDTVNDQEVVMVKIGDTDPQGIKPEHLRAA